VLNGADTVIDNVALCDCTQERASEKSSFKQLKQQLQATLAENKEAEVNDTLLQHTLFLHQTSRAQALHSCSAYLYICTQHHIALSVDV
jgi:thiaminase